MLYIVVWVGLGNFYAEQLLYKYGHVMRARWRFLDLRQQYWPRHLFWQKLCDGGTVISDVKIVQYDRIGNDSNILKRNLAIYVIIDQKA